MPAVECPIESCDYVTPDLDATIVAALITAHANAVHTSSPNQQGAAKVERVKRPSISSAGTSEEWQYFTTRWGEYVAATRVTGKERVLQLLECCDDELRKDLTRSTVGTLSDKTEKDVLAAIKSLAVRDENTMIARVTLNNSHQDRDEPIRSFCARLRGQANVCKYVIDCPNCDHKVDYTEQILRDVICRGLEDSDIRLDLLGQTNQDMTLDEVLSFVEAKETGKRSASKLFQQDENNAIRSSYRRAESIDSPSCTYCGKKGHGAKAVAKQRKNACPAYNHVCSHCNRPHHFESVCRSKNKPKQNKMKPENQGAVFDDQESAFNELCAIQQPRKPTSHHIYNKSSKSWEKRRSSSQPYLDLNVSVDDDSYSQLGCQPIKNHPEKTITIPAMADTGCQSCLIGFKCVQKLGLTKTDLLPVSMEMRAANGNPIKVLGAIILKINSPSSSNNTQETRQLVYVTNETSQFFISKGACIDLGIISSNFPAIANKYHQVASADVLKSATDHLNHPEQSPTPTTIGCDCPKREPPPALPTDLPCAATEENRQKLQDFLLNHYKSSTFNKCGHQPLPMMTGPPMSLQIDESAEPTAHHTPIPVPFHWQEKVKADLDRDVQLGVLEKVPIGEPVTWCHRMVVCAKKNGEPRRTVDFQALNACATRETHHTQSPFHQVRSIPHNVKKTVTDAWNGYHSVPLCEEDKHLTTFITPWGRYRYCTAPQGYISSGDGYTRRFDEIASDFPNKIKVVDDSLLWADTLEESFHQTAQWLDLCARNGIILNPDEFIFGADTVGFAGFEITPTSVRPNEKIIKAIRDFPTPRNLTDVRSWFGLVNQVTYAFSMTSFMEPFRSLLKPKIKFQWNEELQAIFDESKRQIVMEIENGVRIFDKQKPTCLATDWSKSGIGYWLFQKHCDCPDIKPFCCNTGWKVVLVGSRFTHAAESRYAPIEGEALAVADALDKARHFVLGCDNLIVAVDHKPLLGVFSDRSLDTISNGRLRNLKEKTLRYRFKMCYIPGRKNCVSDTMSRHPSGPKSPDKMHLPDDVCSIYQTELLPPRAHQVLPSKDFDQTSSTIVDEEGLLNQSIAAVTTTCNSVTWDMVKEATSSDNNMVHLTELIESGFVQHLDELPEALRPYHQYRSDLSTLDGVVVFKDRIVIPPSLRNTVLDSLHAAHQGINSMIAHAESAVFWPGITKSIKERRSRCRQCDVMAPSQPSMPPTTPPTPEYPFQYLCSDFFHYMGKYYLVSVDRYSNWPIVDRAKDGSAGLINCLRRSFVTYGIPEELASDGGPEFTSRSTESFLKSWGVRQRISSTAFPHSNSRAEIGVKTVKRMIVGNTDASGSLDTDAFQKAMLIYRNTPQPDTQISPAMCIFGHPIRSPVPILPGKYHPHPTWQDTLQKREEALRLRHLKTAERLAIGTRPLPPLKVGDHVRIQNQVGPNPRKWDRTGSIIEVRQFDQYAVRVDGSGRVTLRNRKFLRRFTPVMPKNSSFQIPSPPTPQPFITHTHTPHPTLTYPSQTRPVLQNHPSHSGLDKPAAPAVVKNDECPSSTAPPMSESTTPRAQQTDVRQSDVQPTPVVQQSAEPTQPTPSASNGSPSGVTTYSTPPCSAQQAQHSTSQPRRSQRVKRVPGHLSDYVLK